MSASSPQNVMTNEIHKNVPPDWEPLPAEHLPRPNFFPAGVAMGTTFIFWGLITSSVIVVVGLGLFAASLAGWIYEMLRERRHP